MRRVIFYSVETFIDESHFRFPCNSCGAMVYTPPLMRKYKHVKFNRVFVPMRDALRALRGEYETQCGLCKGGIMDKELDLTVEDLSTIAEYMRGDDSDKPVTVDMKKLKEKYMTSSRLISLRAIMYARAQWKNSNGVL